ncbi:class I SAM-dependent methyltransferase [Azospirillum brasilense]|uniref:Methyltransferase domain-containing protein n=1 Tax=Azospirillum brasilense TaxID=192 RepID=A0A235H942_AZOBR|nr:class I SAM-dependent methyltransferase [Azospirillum brasilense]OYD82350.1 hypothetical protein CHT98_21620 [Azospirillum brasilense]
MPPIPPPYSTDFIRSVVLETLRETLDVAPAAARHGLEPGLVAGWVEQALRGIADPTAGAPPSGEPLSPTPMRWTPALVSRFWDMVAQTRLTDLSFSKLSGPYLLQVIRAALAPGGRHLDYGAGDGHLARLLTTQGFPTAVFEPSEQRLAASRSTMTEAEGFLGVAGSSAEPFDVIMMIEVIEHVLDEDMNETMARVHRLLQPEGTLIVTTPDSEALDFGICCDPVSGRTFHRWQHVRSFTRDNLVELLDRYGFEPVVVHAVEFSERVFGPCGGGLHTDPTFANLFNTPRPLRVGDGTSLVYIGRKKGARKPGAWRDSGSSWINRQLTVEASTHLRVIDTLSGMAPPPDDTLGRVAVPAAAMRPVKGHGWEIDYADLGLSDAIVSPADVERVRIFENALPLGPIQQELEAVCTLGRGRFQAQERAICFSSSDNCPPPQSGRDYSLTYKRRPTSR